LFAPKMLTVISLRSLTWVFPFIKIWVIAFAQGMWCRCAASYIHMILLPFEIINAFTFQSLIDALSEDLMVESWVSYKITWFGIISKHVWNPNSWLRVFTCILHILRLGSEPVKYKNAGLLLFPSILMANLIGCVIIMCQLTVDPESWFNITNVSCITANITEIYILVSWNCWIKIGANWC
jgi:hypothetical protein